MPSEVVVKQIEVTRTMDEVCIIAAGAIIRPGDII